MNSPVNIFWFRRDLRIDDNHGLFRALMSELPVQAVFIFDSNILDELEDRADRRVHFIYQSLQELQLKFREAGATLDIRYGKPLDIFKELVSDYRPRTVFANHDYEPYARSRDREIQDFLKSEMVGFVTVKDQVIFEKSEVLKNDGSPYTVFTPYSVKWKEILHRTGIPVFKSEELLDKLYQRPPIHFPVIEEIGFYGPVSSFPGKDIDDSLLVNYHLTRDYPAKAGTSRLGLHLRFGTIGIRKLVARALALNDKFLNELIWREFYQMILWHFPGVVNKSFRPEFDHINWRNDESEFNAWCDGRTGYPLVDAGIRELNATGYMHNRVRMVCASFLTKHLLIDWRRGEAYFASLLLDYELASNNGGWQWAAGCGCDAAPYFRIFNPSLQAKKFDPEGRYIDKWVPEWKSPTYPEPIVEHNFARNRCLQEYSRVLRRKVPGVRDQE